MPIEVIRAAAYPNFTRWLAAALFAVSRVSLPVIFILLVAGDPQLTPPRLVRLLIAFWAIPGLAAAVLRRAFAADVTVEEGVLTLRWTGLYRRGRRIGVPLASIERVAPWRLPLPGPGLSISASPRVRLEVFTDELPALIGKLRRAGAHDDAGGQAAVVYAAARRTFGITGARSLLLKYGLFPLLPAFIFFRLHQYIMYGGLLGQYHFHGLRPYLSTWLFHWIMALVYLLLYAAFWRALAEIVSWLAAGLAPPRAVDVRRWAERTVAVAYYAGVPLLIALRFLGFPG